MEWYNSPLGKPSLMGADPVDMSAQPSGLLTAPHFFSPGHDGILNGSSLEPSTRPRLQMPLLGADGMPNWSCFATHERPSFVHPQTMPTMPSLLQLPSATETGNSYGGGRARPRPEARRSTVIATVQRPPVISNKRRRSPDFPHKRRVRPAPPGKFNVEVNDAGVGFKPRVDGILGERPGSVVRTDVVAPEEHPEAGLSRVHGIISTWPRPLQLRERGIALDGEAFPRWPPPPRAREYWMAGPAWQATEKGLLGKAPASVLSGADAALAVPPSHRSGKAVGAEESSFGAFFGGGDENGILGILGGAPAQEPRDEPRLFLPFSSSQFPDHGLLGRWPSEPMMPAPLGIPNEGRYAEHGSYEGVLPEHAFRGSNGGRGVYREQSPSLGGLPLPGPLSYDLALPGSSSGAYVDDEGGFEVAYLAQTTGRHGNQAPEYKDAGGYERAPPAYNNGRRLLDRELSQCRDLHASPVDPAPELDFRKPSNGNFLNSDLHGRDAIFNRDPRHVPTRVRPHRPIPLDDNLMEGPYQSGDPALRPFRGDLERKLADREQHGIVEELIGQGLLPGLGLLGRSPQFAGANGL